MGWILTAVLLGSLWLLWNGRANSPRRRREEARWNEMIQQIQPTEKDERHD